MSDITKCDGKVCPQTETCYRFTAPINEYRQSYFATAPWNGSECHEYIRAIPINDADWPDESTGFSNFGSLQGSAL